MTTWEFLFGIPAGQPATMVGSYPTLTDLQTAYPTGQLGNMAMVGTVLYTWDGSAWVAGPDLAGPAGAPGATGPAGNSAQVLGSYATLTDLQTAHPTAGTNDMAFVGGTLYYYDGTQWVAGPDLAALAMAGVTFTASATALPPSSQPTVTISQTP